MKREEKGWRELMEKRRGTTALYLLEDRAGRWSARRRHTKRGGRSNSQEQFLPIAELKELMASNALSYLMDAPTYNKRGEHLLQLNPGTGRSYTTCQCLHSPIDDYQVYTLKDAATSFGPCSRSSKQRQPFRNSNTHCQPRW